MLEKFLLLARNFLYVSWQEVIFNTINSQPMKAGEFVLLVLGGKYCSQYQDW